MVNWKVIGIISITINILLVIGFVGIYNIGQDIVEKESECFNICTESGAISYLLDDVYETCYCYDSNQDLIKSEVLK